jgi:hypothetical protein
MAMCYFYRINQRKNNLKIYAMRKLFTHVLLFFCFINTLFCFQNYNGIRISKTGNDYILNFTLPQYSLINTDVKGEQFTKIVLDD